MDESMKELLDGLRQAMQAERTGHVFYKMAAQNTQDPTGKEVFEQLAREELDHYEYLATHYRSLLEHGTLAATKLGQHSHLGSDSPIFSPALRERIKQAHFEMSALAIAVQLELNGINHYREQAQKAKAPEVKKFFEELAGWESAHYQAFLAQQQSLQEAYWADSGFEPF